MIYELDGSQMQDVKQAHSYLKNILKFPAYYGMTLDSLFDCLTEITEKTVFLVNFPDKIHGKILQVLKQSAIENPFLTIILEN